MSNPKPQTYKNHSRLDLIYHYVLSLALLLNFIAAVLVYLRHPRQLTAWVVIMAIVAVLFWIKLRTYPLKVQDRVIRLEERLRLQSLAPASFQPKIAELSEDQLIGLRFASDEEVVALAEKALAEKLNRKQIKLEVKNWRPDNWRV